MVILLAARAAAARLLRLTVGPARRVVRRRAAATAVPEDRAGWQDQQRRIERWFVRRGLPHFIHRYSAAEDVWTRAFPALVVLFVLQVVGLVNFIGRPDGDDSGIHDGGLLDVVVPAVGIVVLLVTWVGLNLRRGRRPFARPSRLGLLEFAAFVLVPLLPAALRRQAGDAVVTVVGNLLLLGLVYVVTSYGLVSLTRWVLGRLLRQTAIVVGLLARTLPLLLVIVGLLFLSADVWQSAGTQTGAGYVLLLAMLAALAVAFLATTLTRELSGLRTFGSWDEIAGLVERTPAQGLLPEPAADQAEAVPAPSWRQRSNAAVVLFVTQTIQVALVSLLFGLFLLFFGVCAVPQATIQTWMGGSPHVVGHLAFGSLTFAVTEPMLRVVGFLTAFTSLYFSVASLTDATYRQEFYEDTAGQLRQAFAVRAVYLARVVPAARGDVRAPVLTPAPDPVPDADEPEAPVVAEAARPAPLTRRALRAAGHLRPVPPFEAEPQQDVS